MCFDQNIGSFRAFFTEGVKNLVHDSNWSFLGASLHVGQMYIQKFLEEANQDGENLSLNPNWFSVHCLLV
jgi:hypothetical protein